MKKFEVGEYAKVESLSNRVVKIRSITIAIGGTLESVGVHNEREIGFVIDGQVVYTDESNMIKLNLKFKPFGMQTTIRQIKSLHKTYEFSMTFDLGIEVAQIWEMSVGVTIKQLKVKNFVDREKARSWLELEYVKMLVKAKEQK